MYAGTTIDSRSVRQKALFVAVLYLKAGHPDYQVATPSNLATLTRGEINTAASGELCCWRGLLTPISPCVLLVLALFRVVFLGTSY
jgi:hypothetical protein